MTGYLPMLHDILEQFTTTNVFHHHEYIRRSANHLIPTMHNTTIILNNKLWFQH